MDTLSTISAAGAAEAGARADSIVDTSGTIFAIVVACALVLASWVTWVIHVGISQPLASITKALSELAAGNRDIVKDAEILDRLNEAGCEIGQGYHFGKAMPSAEVSKFVRKPHGKGKLLVA